MTPYSILYTIISLISMVILICMLKLLLDSIVCIIFFITYTICVPYVSNAADWRQMKFPFPTRVERKPTAALFVLLRCNQVVEKTGWMGNWFNHGQNTNTARKRQIRPNPFSSCLSVLK